MSVLLTPPVEEPLSLEEAKLHIRVDGAGEDDLISALIVAARSAAEERLGRALLPQTWRLDLPFFPAGDRYHAFIELPRPPFISIESLTYLDPFGATITMPTADYVVTNGGILSRIRHAQGTVWPATLRGEEAVSVTFKAGYATKAAVPAPIKAWMKLFIGSLYENREVVLKGQSGSTSFLPHGFADGLLDPYIVPSVL